MSELHPDLLHPPVYSRLKDLCLTTDLVHNGRAAVTLITPDDGSYADAVAAIRQVIRRRTGAEVPVALDHAQARQEHPLLPGTALRHRLDQYLGIEVVVRMTVRYKDRVGAQRVYAN